MDGHEIAATSWRQESLGTAPSLNFLKHAQAEHGKDVRASLTGKTRSERQFTQGAPPLHLFDRCASELPL